jgi:hypothetical protein
MSEELQKSQLADNLILNSGEIFNLITTKFLKTGLIIFCAISPPPPFPFIFRHNKFFGARL